MIIGVKGKQLCAGIMSEKRYSLICSYLHMHRREHFPHQIDDNHRYYDNAFTLGVHTYMYMHMYNP